MSDLPPLTLFLSPDLDVAWEAADSVARAEVARGHTRISIPAGKLTAAVARDLVRTASLRPISGYAVVLVILEGTVEAVQHVLLKVLEEPGSGVRFLAVASRVLPTVESRASVRRIGSGTEVRARQAELRPVVSAAVSAAAAGDQRRVTRLTREWTEEHLRLLELWGAEGFTRRFRVFSEADMQGYPPVAARSVLTALGDHPTGRPRIVAQVALGRLPRR